MLRKANEAAGAGGSGTGAVGRARRGASAGVLVAAGTVLGNVLAYGFNLVLSRGLGPQGYAELGTLLSVFLIGSVPGMALQAVNARRLAVAVDGPPEALAELCHRLRVRGVLSGAAVAVLFIAIAPAVGALLPAVTTGGVAWTGVSLAAFTVFSGYLGVAQGTSRFVTMTGLYLVAHTTRLAVGIGAAHAGASPTTVMAAQTGAWALAAIAGHVLLRGLTVHQPAEPQQHPHVGGAALPGSAVVTASIPAPRTEVQAPPAKTVHGFVAELLRACGGLGGILLLANLDVLLAGRYLSDGDLGRYNTGALLARAAFFGPSFVAILGYPRLARPEERRRALLAALGVTAAIGFLGVGIAALGGDTLIKAAFGAKYADSAGSFDLGAYGWVFTALGALMAMVNLALLDGVARRSHLVSMIVVGGIVLEAGTVVGFAHHTPGEIITAAASCAVVTAVVSVTACLAARSSAKAHPAHAAGARRRRGAAQDEFLTPRPETS